MTQFLECLFVQYDFEGAQHHLAVCEQVLDDDYFLTSLREVRSLAAACPGRLTRRQHSPLC